MVHCIKIIVLSLIRKPQSHTVRVNEIVVHRVVSISCVGEYNINIGFLKVLSGKNSYEYKYCYYSYTHGGKFKRLKKKKEFV